MPAIVVSDGERALKKVDKFLALIELMLQTNIKQTNFISASDVSVKQKDSGNIIKHWGEGL